MKDQYSINRVKKALAHAEEFNTRRSAHLWIECLIWLGRWSLVWPPLQTREQAAMDAAEGGAS